MKRYYYENMLAKLLLCASSCHTVTVGPFVLSRRKESPLDRRTKNHETTHYLQWAEVTILSMLLIAAACAFFRWSPLWTAASMAVYYLLYAIEWAVLLAVFRDAKKAYRTIGFEQEAYGNENDNGYNESRPLFSGWTNARRK